MRLIAYGTQDQGFEFDPQTGAYSQLKLPEVRAMRRYPHVGETEHGRSGQRVRAGQPLGVVGADPSNGGGIEHLHFEMWFAGDGRAAIDPAPYLGEFRVLDAPELAS